MLISTRGIVLYQADYSETSLIVKIYTENFGLQSYIVKGVRKKGSRIKRNLFGPLSAVDLVAYSKENSGLHMIKDVSCHRQFNRISTNIIKSSITLFMNELLYRSIHGEMPDRQLFAFIYNSVVSLDEAEENLAGFPAIFALQLAGYLGFGPNNNFSPLNCYFDLREGDFSSFIPDHLNFIEPPLSKDLARVLELVPGNDDMLSPASRPLLLEKILDYFRLHLTSFGELKSPQILNTVLRD
jgi:DNA repair protein RecO (recombination protein O)